ncbi:hypothetical protein E5A73_09195 [Sphingomonas gei]|uniref:Uncharacterized protein n=1 Tax=Sphingomonas gei TaxID=1395960 RepID=A0A4S1XDW0_9SPHN|nr:hypothetical protein [Sphingomonas gei]TGX54271.1 hypothetical protein E5A73_09195 [Sphingomonas gei]
MKKVVQVLCVVLIGVAVMIGFRWYRYVASSDTPYDEVGITLNGYMPGPLRSWGCHKLRERFPGALPPYGCAAPDGRSWA